jgi:hypothetical protein
MSEKDLNPETMPLSELKALALAEAEKPQAEPAATLRDEKGQFTKPAQVPGQEDELDNSADTAEETPEEFIVKREIDLGDGSGVQVFTGRGTTELEAVKDMNEKLFEAQRNASKTIRELQKKTPKVDPPAEKTFTDDEEYVFKKLGQDKPSEQFKTLFKEVTGMDVSEFKSTQVAVKEFQVAQRSQVAQQDFVNTHPDYVPNAENGKKVVEWVQSHNYNEFTSDNLEKAYLDLKKSGLLELKSDGASETTEEDTQQTERIARPTVSTTQSRSSQKSSTISSRRSGAPVVKTGPSEDELYSMPLDKLRQLSNEQLAKANNE